MSWKVITSAKVNKQLLKLSQKVKSAYALLIREIEIYGPVRGNWANYGSLGEARHHCHIKKGRPTYVAVWEEINKEIRIIEVTYVGTHEKAPY